MEEKEIWKDVPGYEGIYQASTLGRIRSIDRLFYRNGFEVKVRGRMMKQSGNRGHGVGYNIVSLWKDGERKQGYVHRLVASTFIPNPSGLTCINHKDRDIKNNRVSNLEWCTQQYNVTYMDAHIKRGKNQRKAVLVFNKDGSLFGEFPCCEEAGKALGLRTETLQRYMAGKHKNRDGMTFQYRDSAYEPRTRN